MLRQNCINMCLLHWCRLKPEFPSRHMSWCCIDIEATLYKHLMPIALMLESMLNPELFYCHSQEGTRHLYNVATKSMQHHDVALTMQRCINIMCPLGLSLTCIWRFLPTKSFSGPFKARSKVLSNANLKFIWFLSGFVHLDKSQPL